MTTVTYYWDSWLTQSWAWNPNNLVDGNIAVWGGTTVDKDVEFCNENTCPGTNLGTITKVEIRAYAKAQQSGWAGLKMNVGTGDNTYMPGTSGAWSPYFDVTSLHTPWSWSDVVNLDNTVTSIVYDSKYSYCSSLELRITYEEAGPEEPANPLIGKPLICPDIIKKAIIRLMIIKRENFDILVKGYDTYPLIEK